METAISLSYFIIYMLSIFMIPPRRYHNGYFWRAVRKVLPGVLGDRTHLGGSIMRHLAVYWGWLIICWNIEWKTGVNHAPFFWIPMILICLDDIVNGDDEDRKRRHEWVKNKVKWLWTPQMEPHPLEVRS